MGEDAREEEYGIEFEDALAAPGIVKEVAYGFLLAEQLSILCILLNECISLVQRAAT